jgi:hypothetical protein
MDGQVLAVAAASVAVALLLIWRPIRTAVRRRGTGARATEERSREQVLVVPIPGRGQLSIGVETIGESLSPGDWEVVGYAAALIASSLGQHHTAAGASLLAMRSPGPGRQLGARGGLDVYALGPLRVRRDGQEVRNWGGPKAGTHQAQAIFAFLFDRGERGALKDELIDLIWPDVELGRADLAFHRTIGGLRRALSTPGGIGLKQVIIFSAGRYRLGPDIIRWSDAAAFEDHMDALDRSTDPDAGRSRLASVRRLYRGDYMDDCPFYGDSSQVEVRRQELRDRYVAALAALAEGRREDGKWTDARDLLRLAVAVGGNQVTPPHQASASSSA